MTKITLGKLANVPESLKRSIAQTKVEYRRLGRSGLRVSNPILGGMSIGDSSFFPWILEEAEVRIHRSGTLIRHANTSLAADIHLRHCLYSRLRMIEVSILWVLSDFVPVLDFFLTFISVGHSQLLLQWCIRGAVRKGIAEVPNSST